MASLELPAPLQAYLNRVGAEIVNFRRAIIKSYRGNYYTERATIRIHSDGTLSCSSKEFAPTKEEATAIKAAMAGVEFPRTILATETNLDALLPRLKGEHFEFIDRKSGNIIMVQERRREKSGVKNYLPWVYLSTGEWEMMEPDGGLPFWKPVTGSSGAMIMVHEGAKAAKAANAIVSGELYPDHPWRDELSFYEHWGMIGGALAPQRTNYSELKAVSPTEVIYVCDRDRAGESALQKVSLHWGSKLKGIRFPDTFPESWDMADPLPKSLFRAKRYIGRSLLDLMEPATWATEILPTEEGKRGRGPIAIRSDFADEWHHCVKPEIFVHKDWPDRRYSAKEFDNIVCPFSHSQTTSNYLRSDNASKSAILKYDPCHPSGVYADQTDGRFINTHVPSPIKIEEGDASPWEGFIEQLLPIEDDRKELIRWCATLVCRPEVKMLYGVLLISEVQGIGKGTLGEKILAPLVGASNVSYPSEQEVVDSNYNYWLAHKRLAVVHEIYAGHSSKAYNRLKSTITDKYITVSQKYLANYEIENWLHIFACSNSRRAIKMSMDDRRWFVPRVTEKKQSAAYWARLNNWIEFEGGLSIIKGWLAKWLTENDPVVQGTDAPWSSAKLEIIEEGYSPGQEIVANALDELKSNVNGDATNTFVLDTDLVRLIRNKLYEGKMNDRLERPLTVRNIAKERGWSVGKTRCKVRSWGPEATGGIVIALEEGTANKTPGQLAEEGLKPIMVSERM